MNDAATTARRIEEASAWYQLDGLALGTADRCAQLMEASHRLEEDFFKSAAEGQRASLLRRWDRAMAGLCRALGEDDPTLPRIPFFKSYVRLKTVNDEEGPVACLPTKRSREDGVRLSDFSEDDAHRMTDEEAAQANLRRILGQHFAQVVDAIGEDVALGEMKAVLTMLRP